VRRRRDKESRQIEHRRSSLKAITDIPDNIKDEKSHKMENYKIEQAEEHLRDAEADLKIARDAAEAAEHKIDEALQEKWAAEGTGERMSGKDRKKFDQVKKVLGK
jgi:hypothetical protein